MFVAVVAVVTVFPPLTGPAPAPAPPPLLPSRMEGPVIPMSLHLRRPNCGGSYRALTNAAACSRDAVR
eukprot:5625329-Pyramimonas_sp.AAC.1